MRVTSILPISYTLPISHLPLAVCVSVCMSERVCMYVSALGVMLYTCMRFSCVRNVNAMAIAYYQTHTCLRGFVRHREQEMLSVHSTILLLQLMSNCLSHVVRPEF